jgi:AraC family transcriptional regulator, positive regulator of tynA and feaB
MEALRWRRNNFAEREARDMSWQSADRVVRMRGLVPDVLSSVFVEIEMTNADVVNGRYAISELQGMRIVRSSTNGGRFQVFRGDRHIRRTPSHAVFLCLPLSGDVIIKQNGQQGAITRGDLGLLDSRAGYEIEVSDRADVLWLSLSPTLVEARLRNLPGAVAHRIDGSKGAGLIASKFVRSLASGAGGLKDHHSLPFSSVTIDLVAAALTADDPLSYVQRLGGPRRTWERACDYAERHLGDENLSPAKIAGAVGISTRYLSELFASQGTTTMEWVARRRLESCRAVLQSHSWAPGIITEIALQFGFGNISSFNRSFKEAFGIAPRKVMRHSMEPKPL